MVGNITIMYYNQKSHHVPTRRAAYRVTSLVRCLTFIQSQARNHRHTVICDICIYLTEQSPHAVMMGAALFVVKDLDNVFRVECTCERLCTFFLQWHKNTFENWPLCNWQGFALTIFHMGIEPMTCACGVRLTKMEWNKLGQCQFPVGVVNAHKVIHEPV